MRRPIVPMLLALPFAALLGLGACARSSDDSAVPVASGTAATPSSGSSASADSRDQALKFAQCMREHGVPMDDPDPNGQGVRVGGPGTDQQKISAAEQACRQYAPFGDGTGQQQPDPALREKILKFAQCMRDNGVPNFPDPQAGMTQLDEKVTSDPDFPQAQQTCEQKYLSNIPGTW